MLIKRRARSLYTLVIALIAACAVTVAAGSSAFAAEPGETGLSRETAGGGNQVQTSDTLGEARSPSNTVVTIWRGYFEGTEDQVYIAVNNGNIIQIANQSTSTVVAPRILYSNGYFYAFFTGANGYIYWSRAAEANVANPTSWMQWTQTNTVNMTNQSVSVASSPAGILMAYRGVGNDQRLFTTWLPNGSGNWDPAQTMFVTSSVSNGSTIYSGSAPSITYDPANARFLAVWRGITDSTTYSAYQFLGAEYWLGLTSLAGPVTDSSPVVAALDDGSYLVSTRDQNTERISDLYITSSGGYTSWQPETSNYQTSYSPFIYAAGRLVYMLLVGQYAGEVYWKIVYNKGG